jgi:chromosome segregation ATPase
MSAICDDSSGGVRPAPGGGRVVRDDLAGDDLAGDDLVGNDRLNRHGRIGDDPAGDDNTEGTATAGEDLPAAAAARARLAGLRRDAAVVYDSIIAADDELRALAGYRVAAERALLAAGQRRQQAEKALEEYARANPGLRARLSAALWARRERRAQRTALTAALYDCAQSVQAARRAYAQSQARFAATVAARAEAAARLRGLTEECAAVQQALAGAGDRPASGSGA